MYRNMPGKRGQIIDKKRKRQIIDFSQIRYKNITPTDIDWPEIEGAFEVKGNVFLFIDMKYKFKDLEFGQRLFFERLAECLTKPAIIVIARHNIENTEDIVPAHECPVIEYLCNKIKIEWIKPKKDVNCKELCDWFVKKYSAI